ncbi:hypothetical protein ACIRQP_39520 [Streptomyces sp. NPDC102274]
MNVPATMRGKAPSRSRLVTQPWAPALSPNCSVTKGRASDIAPESYP